MKRTGLFLASAIVASSVFADTLITEDGDYVEVPEGKRAVFIKDTLPTEHCVVTCIAPVMEPPKEPVTEPVYCDEDGGLVVSPSICIQRPE